MEIRWLGNSTFEVKSSAGAVVVDHQGALPKQSDLEDQNTVFVFSKGARANHPVGKHNVLVGPGEYEIGGLSIRGVATPADDPAVSREINTVYIVTESQGLEPDELTAVIRNLEPKMIVPSGYDADAGKPSAPMQRLLTELGVQAFEATSKLTVSKSGLSEEQAVVVLQQRLA